MMGATATVKNWTEFQHYKDRDPPWVKLHRKLLDDFTFAGLPIASKALAPMLWLLAAETKEGRVSIDPEYLSFRLRWKLSEVTAGLTPLIDRGFLVPDSSALAQRKQAAAPEAEAEREKEKTLSDKSLGFDVFWKAYPNKKGRIRSEKIWARKNLGLKLDSLLSDVRIRLKSDPDWLRGAIPHGSTYLNEERWQDAIKPDAPAVSVAGTSPSVPVTRQSQAEANAALEAYVKEVGFHV